MTGGYFTFPDKVSQCKYARWVPHSLHNKIFISPSLSISPLKQNHFIHFSPNFRQKTSISDSDKSIQKFVKSKSPKSSFQHHSSTTSYIMDYTRKPNKINKNRYILKLPSHLRRKKSYLQCNKKLLIIQQKCRIS